MHFFFYTFSLLNFNLFTPFSPHFYLSIFLHFFLPILRGKLHKKLNLNIPHNLNMVLYCVTSHYYFEPFSNAIRFWMDWFVSFGGFQFSQWLITKKFKKYRVCTNFFLLGKDNFLMLQETFQVGSSDKPQRYKWYLNLKYNEMSLES